HVARSHAFADARIARICKFVLDQGWVDSLVQVGGGVERVGSPSKCIGFTRTVVARHLKKDRGPAKRVALGPPPIGIDALRISEIDRVAWGNIVNERLDHQSGLGGFTESVELAAQAI